jgi:zinc/manganese transport system substrate-binding protein
MRKILTLSRVVAVCSLGVMAVACGSDESGSPAQTTQATAETPAPAETAPETAAPGTAAPDTAAPDTAAELPTIVVTTNILGDIVTQAVGDLAAVEVIMPVGSDPHDFSPSARQAESMENADLLVVNGAGFEEGMIGIIEQVESTGTRVFEFADHIELLEFDGDHGHSDDGHSDDDHDHDHSDDDHSDDDHSDDDHSDDDHSDDDHSDDHDHDHSGGDPHIWTDPARMITAVEAFGEEFATIDGIDGAAVEAQVQAYVDELKALDADMEQTLSAIPAENRVLVTNHEVFGYFADRFQFEVVGAVVPSLTTSAEPSTAEVEALVQLIEQEQIPAIFADTSSPTRLAEAIASSADNDVEVVVLYSESLGEPGSGAETYIGMMSTNAALIAAALAPA